MSTRIFEKVVDENLSALLEITPNHGFYGTEEVQNDMDETKRRKMGKQTEKYYYANFCIYINIGNFDDSQHTLKEALLERDCFQK